MLIFILSVTALVLISLLILMPALLNKTRLRQVDLQAKNAAIARERLSVLEGDDTQTHAELEATLLDDLRGPDYQVTENHPTGIKTALAVMILIPIAAVMIYGQVGHPDWLTLSVARAPFDETQQSEPHTDTNIETLLARLEQTLEDNPGNADGWALAGRTYMSLGRFSDAESAYSRVQQLVGDDPDILTAWADASLMANDTRYTMEISRRIRRALELDPNQVNALWIGGIGENSIGRSEQALAYLTRLLPLIQQDPEAASRVEFMIERIGGGEALAATTGEVEISEEATRQSQDASLVEQPGHAGIVVSVSIDPALKDKAAPTDLVFIFARAPDGPPFPLAVTRISVADLPIQVTLDDSMAMIPDQNISSVAEVSITARISKSGGPIAKPGDLISENVVSPVAGQPSVSLVIDRLME